MHERYFDNAATTPVDPHVREAMLPFLDEFCGNAQSLHSLGRQAMAAVENARAAVAALLGEENPETIVFTAGATEANNWIAQRNDCVCSPFEHSSMLESVLASGGETLPNEGYELFPSTAPASVCCVMHVNNETGAILDSSGLLLPMHRDITQSVGKVDLPSRFATASLSAHKFYGPKGIGALWHPGLEWIDEPLLYGGEHEGGRRAGTLNVPAIVGMGEAAKIAADRSAGDFSNATALRSIVLEELRNVSDWEVNEHERQSPFILSLSFLNMEGQTITEEADRRGFALSSGAACSSRSTEPSHVLTALGVEPEWARGTIRISFGRSNTRESASELGKSLVEIVHSVRKLQASS